MGCYLVKFQSCLLGRMCNLEFLQVIITFFSKTVWPRNMKFGLHRVSIWVNMQKNFKFLCRTVSEKKAILIWILYANQISCSLVTQFSRKMRWYLAKIQMCTIALINNFEILHVSIAFFSDTLWLGTWNFIYILTHMDTLCKPNFIFLGHTVFGEKCDDNLQKFKVAQLGPLCNNLKFYNV